MIPEQISLWAETAESLFPDRKYQIFMLKNRALNSEDRLAVETLRMLASGFDHPPGRNYRTGNGMYS